MASYNSITLMGNITRDIELRTTPGGVSVCDVGLATNRKFYNKTAQSQQEDVCFIDCTAFGNTADIIHQYLRKGSQVLFRGRLSQDTWSDKETGAKRSKHKVIIEEMQMLGGSPQSTAGEENQDTYQDDVPF